MTKVRRASIFTAIVAILSCVLAYCVVYWWYAPVLKAKSEKIEILQKQIDALEKK